MNFFNESNNSKSVVNIKRTQTLEKKILLNKKINKEEVSSVLSELSKYLNLKKKLKLIKYSR